MSWNQRQTDLETIQAYLDRGTHPEKDGRWWGGFEFAVSRLTGIMVDPDRIRYASCWEDTPIYWAVLYGKKE